MKYYAGIDIGSISTEVVIVDENGEISGYAIEATGSDSSKAVSRAFAQIFEAFGIRREDISYIVSTGYGRERVEFANERITEITCHSVGAYSLFPATRTVIDIGGQDSKAIRLDDQGFVQAFQMNDKCAAGTGRFLEVMARALEVEVKDMGELSLRSKKALKVSNVCTVFTESEVVGLIARGECREDILYAINQAVADRVMGLVSRVGISREVTLSGGVAKNIGVRKALESRIGFEMNVPNEPQIVGAFGAAILARRKAG